MTLLDRAIEIGRLRRECQRIVTSTRTTFRNRSRRRYAGAGIFAIFARGCRRDPRYRRRPSEGDQAEHIGSQIVFTMNPDALHLGPNPLSASSHAAWEGM